MPWSPCKRGGWYNPFTRQRLHNYVDINLVSSCPSCACSFSSPSIVRCLLIDSAINTPFSNRRTQGCFAMNNPTNRYIRGYTVILYASCTYPTDVSWYYGFGSPNTSFSGSNQCLGEKRYCRSFFGFLQMQKCFPQ